LGPSARRGRRLPISETRSTQPQSGRRVGGICPLTAPARDVASPHHLRLGDGVDLRRAMPAKRQSPASARRCASSKAAPAAVTPWLKEVDIGRSPRAAQSQSTAAKPSVSSFTLTFSPPHRARASRGLQYPMPTASESARQRLAPRRREGALGRQADGMGAGVEVALALSVVRIRFAPEWRGSNPVAVEIRNAA
jgi:hypothetical protein